MTTTEITISKNCVLTFKTEQYKMYCFDTFWVRLQQLEWECVDTVFV